MDSTIYMRHQVPGASAPLVIPVHLLVNVPDDVISANVSANAIRPGPSRFGRIPRVKTTAPHDGVAILCGSGPSLGDHLGLIRDLRTAGGDLFALNGAAKFLDSVALTADYQVLVDARPQTAEVIGPARKHLVASQCDPVVFDRLPHATMWHFINGDLEAMLPADEEAHAQIGGAGSVGNCALALAYAMGYRRFEVFGYDSSHRGDASHVAHQAINDFEPWGRFEFKGKDYICSFTMRSQASRFQAIARALLAHGCTVTVHGDGLLPDMWRDMQRIRMSGTIEEREQAKYSLVWAMPQYRQMSPAEEYFEVLYAALGSPDAGTLLDFGCGTGRVTKRLQGLGLAVTGVDFVREALETDIPFVEGVLWDLPPLKADFGICCDVMEHIPPAKVDDVLAGIRRCVAGPVFFSISTEPDGFGTEIGEILHETVRPADWWRAKLEAHWPDVSTTVGPSLFICKPKGTA